MFRVANHFKTEQVRKLFQKSTNKTDFCLITVFTVWIVIVPIVEGAAACRTGRE